MGALKTAELRNKAKKQGVEGWEDMERKDLIVALKTEEKPAKEEEPPKVEAPSSEEAESKEPAIGIEEGVAPVGSKEETMKKALAKQPKKTVFIPLGETENIRATKSVILDGYRLNIQKGVYVDVPEQVFEIIMESEKQARVALESPLKIRVGGKSELEK